MKIRLQTQGATAAAASQPAKGAVTIIRELGIRGLYSGAPVTMLRDVPYSFIFFPVYSNLRNVFLDKKVKFISSLTFSLSLSLSLSTLHTD